MTDSYGVATTMPNKEPTYLELIGLGPEDLARYSKQENYEQQFNRELARSLEVEKQLIAQGRQKRSPSNSADTSSIYPNLC